MGGGAGVAALFENGEDSSGLAREILECGDLLGIALFLHGDLPWVRVPLCFMGLCVHDGFFLLASIVVVGTGETCRYDHLHVTIGVADDVDCQCCTLGWGWG